MKIQINGELSTIETNTTLMMLLENLSIADKRLAVERNEEIVPRSQYAQTQLEEGDDIEIVHAIGGG